MKKKLISAVAVAMAASMTLTACGGAASSAASTSDNAASEAATTEAESSEGYKPMKIAFAAQAVDETFVEAKDALENEIDPL